MASAPALPQTWRMYDAHPQMMMQRARGRALVALGPDGRGKIGLRDLAQAGSAKAFLPSIHAPVPEVVFLNTSGGLTGGDDLEFRLDLGAGARAVATTQTAERAYASGGGRAEMRVMMQVGAGGRLDWLPQETILYQGSGLARLTRVDLASDARFLMAEMVVLGRAAMGETVTDLAFSDRREVWRAGRPVWIEPFALGTPALDRADAAPRAALLQGARAFATLAFVVPGAEAAVAALRALTLPDVSCAVSGWDGRLILRVHAADGLPLKRGLAAILKILRQGAPLPRVWQI
jgi:urease accessory protein